MNKIPPIILLIIATILWGGNFVIGRAVTSDISPYTLAFFRWLIAFMIFFPFVRTALKQEWKLIRQNLSIVLFMSLTGIAAFNTLLYVALHYTTAINASLMNTTAPILIYIMSFIFLKERLSKQQIIGAFISLSGVVAIISNGSLESLKQLSFNFGDLIMLIAVITWSVYSLLVKQYANQLPGNSTFLVTMFLGIVILFPFFMYETLYVSMSITWSLNTISAIFYTSIFASVVAFLSWNNGVVRLGANKAGIFLNFVPVFATVFAVVFIGESLKLVQAIGGLLVVLGVYLTTRK